MFKRHKVRSEPDQPQHSCLLSEGFNNLRKGKEVRDGKEICRMKHYGGESEEPAYRVSPLSYSGVPGQVLCLKGCGSGFMMCTEHQT